jgi:hypothetical protein
MAFDLLMGILQLFDFVSEPATVLVRCERDTLFQTKERMERGVRTNTYPDGRKRASDATRTNVKSQESAIFPLARSLTQRSASQWHGVVRTGNINYQQRLDLTARRASH